METLKHKIFQPDWEDDPTAPFKEKKRVAFLKASGLYLLSLNYYTMDMHALSEKCV